MKLAPGEQAVLDKAMALLRTLIADGRTDQANGWIGIKVNIQNGVLKGTPRESVEVSRQ